MSDTLQRVTRWLGALTPEKRAHWERYLASAGTPAQHALFVERLSIQAGIDEDRRARDAVADAEKQQERDLLAAAIAKAQQALSQPAAAKREPDKTKPFTLKDQAVAIAAAMAAGHEDKEAVRAAVKEKGAYKWKLFEEAWKKTEGKLLNGHHASKGLR